MEIESFTSLNNRNEEIVHVPKEMEVEAKNETPTIEVSTGVRQPKIPVCDTIAVVSLLVLVCGCALLSHWAITHDWKQSSTEDEPETTPPSVEVTTTKKVFQTSVSSASAVTKPSIRPTPTTSSNFSASSASTFSQTTDSSSPDTTLQNLVSPISTTKSKSFSSSATTSATDRKMSTTTKASTSSGSVVIFVRGSFNFSQAKQACAKRGRSLARQEDMVRAYEQGYERCKYGWLLERQYGYVMQTPNPRCGGGRLGLILTGLKSTHQITNGAYCAFKAVEETPATFYQTPPPSGKSVNWWVSYNPSDVYNLKHLLQHKKYNSWMDKKPSRSIKNNPAPILMRAIRAIYICCRIFSVEANLIKNSTFIKQRITSNDISDLVSSYKKEFRNPKIKVFAQVTGTYTTMMSLGGATLNRSATLSELVRKASQTGLDGIVFDYEPKQDYSRKHAEIYRKFLDELADRLQKYNMEAATVVAQWGILKYFDIYARSKCSIIGSMSNTYFGGNISLNFRSVDIMMKSINSSRLQIGIATERMKIPAWNKTELRRFVEGISRKGITGLHLYSGGWNGFNHIKNYFLKILIKFIEET